jgi:hypothetical protein
MLGITQVKKTISIPWCWEIAQIIARASPDGEASKKRKCFKKMISKLLSSLKLQIANLKQGFDSKSATDPEQKRIRRDCEIKCEVIEDMLVEIENEIPNLRFL